MIALIDDEAKRAQVREFLEALSPSELRRIVELFRMQLDLPPLGVEQQAELKGGLERCLPGKTMTAKA